MTKREGSWPSLFCICKGRRRMRKQGLSEGEPEAYSSSYVEGLSDPRTRLEAWHHP